MSALSDDFDGPSLDTTLWTVTSGGSCSVGQGGGWANLHASVQGCTAGLASQSSFDLAGQRAAIEIPAPLMGAGVFTFQLISGEYNIRFMIDSGGSPAQVSTWAKTDVNDEPRTYQDFNGTSHRWLAISESGGILAWESSSDGTSWSSFGTIATSTWFATDCVALDLQASAVGAGGFEIKIGQVD